MGEVCNCLGLFLWPVLLKLIFKPKGTGKLIYESLLLLIHLGHLGVG